MAAKRRTAKRMESQSMGAASRRMSRSQAKERRQDEKRERKMKCQVSRRSSPTFSPTWETELVREVGHVITCRRLRNPASLERAMVRFA